MAAVMPENLLKAQKFQSVVRDDYEMLTHSLVTPPYGGV
jgi:hypothetical protein